MDILALVGVIGLALWLQRRNRLHPTQKKSTDSAADQTNSDLGSASALANLFNVAGLMPYSGGNTYVNTTTPVPEQTVTVNVGKDQTVGELVEELRNNGYPGFNWADFWSLNPGIVSSAAMEWQPNKDWKFTQWSTPVVVYKPGTKMGLPVSGNAPGTVV
jgi:hypothetical protein